MLRGSQLVAAPVRLPDCAGSRLQERGRGRMRRLRDGSRGRGIDRPRAAHPQQSAMRRRTLRGAGQAWQSLRGTVGLTSGRRTAPGDGRVLS
eukprot:505345-Prymnesium_polylepis.1